MILAQEETKTLMFTIQRILDIAGDFHVTVITPQFSEAFSLIRKYLHADVTEAHGLVLILEPQPCNHSFLLGRMPERITLCQVSQMIHVPSHCLGQAIVEKAVIKVRQHIQPLQHLHGYIIRGNLYDILPYPLGRGYERASKEEKIS